MVMDMRRSSAAGADWAWAGVGRVGGSGREWAGVGGRWMAGCSPSTSPYIDVIGIFLTGSSYYVEERKI